MRFSRIIGNELAISSSHKLNIRIIKTEYYRFIWMIIIKFN